MTASNELPALIDALPPDKVRSVLDRVRYLSEQSEDEAWDRRVESARTSPRFGQRLAGVERDIAAGKATPIDPDGL